MKKNKDFRVSHVKRAESFLGASTRLTPIQLGPLAGCPTTEPHFASSCAACKSLYARYLRERETNIAARIADQSVPVTQSPFRSIRL